MKKWMYVIFPAILLAIFLMYYRQEMTVLMAKEKARAENVARIKAEDARKKKETEERARSDNEKRMAEQAAEDAKIAKDKEDKWNATGREIQADTDKALSETSRYQNQDADLDVQLAALQKAKEKANREDFEMLKEVELSRVAYETAQLEVERMVAMIASRADQSSMTKMPPPVPKKEE